MKKTMKYSVMRYSPSAASGERINLGIIMDAEEDGYREFRFPKSTKRLCGFDDEVDLSLVRAMLANIKEDVEGSLLTTTKFNIDQYVKFFINSYSFDRPKQILYEDIDEVTETLYKTFFRFEYEKKDRPSIEEDRNTIARLIKDSGKEVKRRQSIVGEFEDRVTYDLITDDYKIKLFDFDNKNLKKIINSAKTWAWNGMHESEGKSIIVVYHYSDNANNIKEDPSFKIIHSILTDAGIAVLDMDQAINKVQSSNRQSFNIQ